MCTYIAFECCFEQYTRGLTLMILPFGRLHVKLILDNTFQCLQRRVKKYILIAVSDKEKKKSLTGPQLCRTEVFYYRIQFLWV